MTVLGCVFPLFCASADAPRAPSGPAVVDAIPRPVPRPNPPAAAHPRTSVAKVRLVPFRTSAFPYRGRLPWDGTPFLDTEIDGRRGHTSARGGLYWEDETYSDRRVLLAIPPGFNPRRRALMILFFHGNEGRLERDVRDRQQVVRQVADSGLNAVLVAPQLAVDALDSSAGNFWTAGHFARFLQEADTRLADLYGDPRMRDAFRGLPVVIVAYSGGYQPALHSLDRGGAGERVHGLVLLDALYGEEGKIASAVARRYGKAFLVSAFGPSTRDHNLVLEQTLAVRGVPWRTALPRSLGPRSVVFVDAGDDVVHGDFVTEGWVANPLQDVLARVEGFPRGKR